MKAILATQQGAIVQEVPVPTPAAGQILVKVRATGLNRADLHTLALGQNNIIGMEWAGTVEAVGPGVQMYKAGDAVMCSGKHAFAEYAVADCGRTIPMPENLSFREGAAMMMALQTAHNAVATHGRLQKDDVVVIQGASSGVGLMTAQIAQYLGAGLVIGTSRDAQRRAAMLNYGIDLALDSSDAAWVDAVMARTQGQGVNVIIDYVSGPGFNDLMLVAATQARIVNVGRLGGAQGPFDFETHALKRLCYTGVTFRTRSAEEITELTAAMHRDLGDALSRGALAFPLDQDFPLAEAQQAFDRMRANRHFGKITLAVGA